ncbi:hypothetical protein CRG98_002319 [Punica granatum]|uniref:Uncharacterized protein n=1 Tax=Punica granatum TaxID=22663 RepID=A0A2I0L9K7_PUNGR|nr:hypothetical protein CRG98_002319 [Punica granatum]
MPANSSLKPALALYCTKPTLDLAMERCTRRNATDMMSTNSASHFIFDLHIIFDHHARPGGRGRVVPAHRTCMPVGSSQIPHPAPTAGDGTNWSPRSARVPDRTVAGEIGYGGGGGGGSRRCGKLAVESGNGVDWSARRVYVSSFVEAERSEDSTKARTA